MKKFVSDDTYHIVYEDLSEFFSHTDPSKPSSDMHRSNVDKHEEIKRRTRGSDNWTYGDEERRNTFLDVRFDPAKGKNLCLEAVKKTMADSAYKKLVRQALTYKKRISFQDHGFRLNVSKAISGEDRYFSVYSNARKPIVKIAINICGSACVGQEEFKKVAQTAIPTIYALETAGIATEVYYTAFAEGTHNVDDFSYSATHVKIKSARERFNWTTFAPVFCLGSYRESIFLSWINSEHKVDSGLGTPMPDSSIKRKNNYGYTSVIGLNAVGPAKVVSEIFQKIGKKEC